MLKKIKEKDELKIVEVDVVTKFIKDDLEIFTDDDDVDVDDDVQVKIIGFR